MTIKKSIIHIELMNWDLPEAIAKKQSNCDKLSTGGKLSNMLFQLLYCKI